ncbi:MAG: saccharopine dehydrogenase family protein [Nevskiales bacterium]
MNTERKYDVVVFGATGYTGLLTAEYLARQAPPDLKWALAGRNPDKLAEARAHLAGCNSRCSALELIAADVGDAASMARLAQSTKVVITTVGPYILYGEPLVKACAEAGTHYVDLTGEPEFVDLMWLGYHETARKNGARIVHSCGFDSIPHDLGAYFTVQQLPAGQPIKLEGFVRAGGTFSGGTYHSAVNAFARMRKYAMTRRERMAKEDWPKDRRIGSTLQRIRFDKRVGTWVVPFPSVDPQVVRRSAAALDRYGPNFRYGHYIQVKRLASVAGLLGGVTGLFLGAQLKLTRNWLLSAKDPGQGPTEEQRRKGWFKVTFLGEAGGVKIRTQVTGGDPGYGETSKMLAESAMCLARDRLPSGVAGQLTPAVAMGDALLKRLQEAGIKFEVLSREG